MLRDINRILYFLFTLFCFFFLGKVVALYSRFDVIVRISSPFLISDIKGRTGLLRELVTSILYGDILVDCQRFFWQNLAAQKTYNNLSMSMQEAVRRRRCYVEGVIKCYPDETLETVIDRIVKAEVRKCVLN